MNSDFLHAYENGELVPVEASPEDLQALEDAQSLVGEDSDEEIKSLATKLAYSMVAHMLRRALSFIIDEEHPKLAAEVAGSCFGMRLHSENSDVVLAEEKYNIAPSDFIAAKQAFLRHLEDSKIVIKNPRVFIADAEDPRLRRDIIKSALGLSAREGASDTQIAAKYGISKEAFDQRKKRFLKGLGLKRVVVRGAKKATDAYRNANYRNYKRSLG